MQLICNRLAANAAGLRPYEFLFFVVGSLRLGRLYSPELADATESGEQVSPDSSCQLLSSSLPLYHILLLIFVFQCDSL